MKKYQFLFFLLAAMILSSCGNQNDVEDKSNIKPSEVFVFSGNHSLLAKSINTKDSIGYDIPDANGCYQVFYYIRIDGKIPGWEETNLPASAYFPRTSAGKTMISELNRGYVTANAAWRTDSKFSKYIYSTDGSAVQSVIVSEPTLEDMINANQGKGDDFSGYLEHKDELHFLWYACKKQDADHVWHIDGILTTKERTDISETDYGQEIEQKYEHLVADSGDVVRKGHVEVDVHQQEHKDWNEIKTSIHLRDTVIAEVFLPIGYQELADDFDIRVGKDYEYVTEIKNCKIEIEGQPFDLEVSITHEQKGIRIVVNPNKEALKAARLAYADGLTFEVHTYVSTLIPNDVIWEKVKQTTCKVSPYTDLYGQITSAYFNDRVDLGLGAYVW